MMRSKRAVETSTQIHLPSARDVRTFTGLRSADFPSRYPIGSILDEISARPEQAKNLGLTRVRGLLARAEHFLLDEEAGARVVDMVQHNARLIVELRQFALMPFPAMTISLPTRAKSDVDRETLILMEERDGMQTYALALRNTGSGTIGVVDGWYVAAEDQSGESRTVIRVDNAPFPTEPVLREQIGVYSMAIDAVLLFLNQKRGVQLSEPTARRKSLLRGRPVTYFARRTVTIGIMDPNQIRHNFVTGERGPSRRHAVRGHFFHRGGTLNCEHRWARLDGHDNAWECVDCDRRRFWRRDFERGDVNKGVVASRYKITGRTRGQ